MVRKTPKHKPPRCIVKFNHQPEMAGLVAQDNCGRINGFPIFNICGGGIGRHTKGPGRRKVARTVLVQTMYRKFKATRNEVSPVS